MENVLNVAYYLTRKIKKKIGNNIKKIRQKKNLKQIQVSVDAGIASSYFGRIERGQVNPSLEKLYRIIRALKAKSSDILPF